MAKDKVYITLEVTDKGTAVVRGFDANTKQAFDRMKSNAKASTTSMGSSIDKLKKHWVAFSAAAVAGFLMVRKAITAVLANIKEWINLSKVQEKAEITLAAALKASGEYTDTLNKRYQEFASSIQKVTTYGDEQVLGLMALIKNLGVSTGKVEEATKMAIGLAAATNRDVQSMAQYVALAMQGEYTMLRRYIPALRATTDATEQMKIVTDFAARGFKVAQETTRSYSDSLTQLRNLWLDLKEKLADVITRNEAVLALIQRGKKYVTDLNEQLVKWYENNQAIINQKTREAIDTIATAISDLVWALKALYKLRNVFKELFFAIPGIKELSLIKDIIDKIRPAKIEAPSGVITMPIIKPELPLLEDATPKETAVRQLTIDYGELSKAIKAQQALLKGPTIAEFLKEQEAIISDTRRKISEADWGKLMGDPKQATADRVNAYRAMYGDIKSLSWENYDLQVELLKKQRDEFLAITGDMATVSAWYAEKEKELIIEKNQAILESTTSLTEGLAAAWENYILQTKSDIEQLAELSITISQTIAKGIGDAFAQAIIYGKDMGESFKALMKSVAATIISSLIEIGVQRLIQWIMAQMLNLKEATSRMAVLAAETYAGAFAATAAIPIIGPALAPGVAAASLATMLAGATAAGTAGGTVGATLSGVLHEGIDYVPRTGPYLLEKGEKVIPAKDEYYDEDRPVMQVNVILDKRVVTKAVLHTIDIDRILLDRFRKTLS